MGLYSFPKPHRLSGRTVIEKLFDSGEGGFAYPLRYRFLATEADGQGGVSVLVTVSKKYHKRAVKRNLLKRRIREAFRTSAADLRATAEGKGMRIDIALMYSTKEVLEFQKINDAVGKILAQIQEGI